MIVNYKTSRHRYMQIIKYSYLRTEQDVPQTNLTGKILDTSSDKLSTCD